MAVYFVYRCTYDAPTEKHIRRFEYNSVLDWAKAVFRQLGEDEAYNYARELLGGLNVYSFGSMFMIHKDSPPSECPQTMEEVGDWFTSMYDQGQANGPHHIQILTDDDELEMAVYVFDDYYRKANPGKADFLLHEGWELPDGDADGAFIPPAEARLEDHGSPAPGDPVTYAAFLAHYDSGNLIDLSGGFRIGGGRVADLARTVLTKWANIEMYGELGMVQETLGELLASPSGEDAGFLAAIRDQPDELTNWGVYSDWLQEHEQPVAGLKLLHDVLKRVNPRDGSIRPSRDPSKDMIRVTPHMVQAVYHTARWKTPRRETDLYHQWIFFDDRWAAAHPTLAAGILTFASRWDVLS
jgi:uncharacterized protein (TIGR02996 family)